MNILRVGYFRVSKEDESLQDLDRHKEVTFNKFNVDPKNVFILSERISGYKLDKLEGRTKFLELVDLVFDGRNTSLVDLFAGRLTINYDEVHIYTYDYNRFSRRMKYNLIFSLIADLVPVRIFSYNQSYLLKKDGEELTETMGRMINLFFLAYSSESYSLSSSKNISKSVYENSGLKIGKKNGIDKIWGKGMRTLDKTKLNVEETIKKRNEIVELMKHKTFKQIQDIFISKYNIKPSMGYLSDVKKYNKQDLSKK